MNDSGGVKLQTGGVNKIPSGGVNCADGVCAIMHRFLHRMSALNCCKKNNS